MLRGAKMVALQQCENVPFVGGMALGQQCLLLSLLFPRALAKQST